MAEQVTISIQDESAVGNILNKIRLEFDRELLKVKDVIQARVYAEVQQYNSGESPNSLVVPTELEAQLKVTSRRKVDAEQQYLLALDAFQQNGYFVLIDNKQAEDLDEEVLLTNDTVVSFVKLTPLVGG